MPAKVFIPDEAIQMYLDGENLTECANSFGIKVPTFYKRLKSLGISTRDGKAAASRSNSFYRMAIRKNKTITRSGCWEWSLSKHKSGYGRTCYRGKEILAHRLAFIVFNGAIPDGLVVRHKCDNPSCVNPDHLLTGTHQDNMDDRNNRNNQAKGESIANSVLTESASREIRKSTEPVSALVIRYSVCKQTIYNVINNHTWKTKEKPNANNT